MKRHILILTLLSLLVFAPGIFSPRGFWTSDEARYGDILREMTVNDHWLVLHLNGDFYPDKPPLYFWLCAIVCLVTGKVTVFACMVITWLSSLACLLATYFLGRELMAPPKALAGTLVLMSVFLFTLCAEIVRMDMLMAAFIVMAYVAFVRGTRSESRKEFFLFHLFCGLAVLTKGPLGFALAFFPALIVLFMLKKPGSLKRFLLNPGLPLPLLLPGGWLLTAWLLGHRAYIDDIVFKQVIGRSVNSWSHEEPFYYYLMILPVLFLPWTPFLVRALARGRSVLEAEAGRLLVVWFAFGFVLLSAVSGKLIIYVLPILPPLALFLGAHLHDLVTGDRKPGRADIIEGCVATLLTFGALAAVPFVTSARPETAHLDLDLLAWIFIPLVVLGVVFSVLKKRCLVLGAQFAGMALVSLAVFIGVMDDVDPIYNPEKIGADLQEYAARGYETSTYRLMTGILAFSAEQRIGDVDRESLFDYFEGGPKRLLFMREKYYNRHKEKLGDDVEVLRRYSMGMKDYCLVGPTGSD